MSDCVIGLEPDFDAELDYDEENRESEDHHCQEVRQRMKHVSKTFLFFLWIKIMSFNSE